MNTNKNIVIIGMPGSGKTTIGYLVSKKLNMKFVDMDDYIVKKENMAISDMFAIGEIHFRNIETQCAEQLSYMNSHVIATGGGIVKRKENMNYLKNNSIIVFLNRPIEMIFSDINISTRPLLKDSIENLHNLHNERFYLYREYCDFEILNDKSIDDAVNSIVKLIEKI